MAGRVKRVTIPYQPRPLQKVLHAALDGHRFAVAVCHRRFGKTVLAINQLQKCALRHQRTDPPPRFAYVMPYLKQGKDVVWKYMQQYSAPIPGVVHNHSELSVTYPNGAYLRIYGADNEKSLRGVYLDGIVLDEYGDMSATIFPQVIRPMLSDYGGWAFFIGTPNGRNQFYDVVQDAKSKAGWFFAEYKASHTGVVAAQELADAREQMTDDEYQQEYECSFEASVKGAVYARELQSARDEGRITHVPYDPALPVDTFWDLGIRDTTAIWFAQRMYGGAVHVIDYHEDNGHGLDHYASLVKSKPYGRGNDGFPHDINQRELTSGKSRLEFVQGLGLNVLLAPRLQVDEGVHAARMLFSKCWFDSQKCAQGLNALAGYHYRINAATKYWAEEPVHDQASHGADAFRTLAVLYQQPRFKREREKPDTDWMDGPRFRPPRRGQQDSMGGRGGYR